MRTENARGSRIRSLLVGVAAGLVSGLAVAAVAENGVGPVSTTAVVVPYDGYLTLGGEPINDTVSITFRLHSGPSCNGCEVWSETQQVVVHGGKFSVGLGAIAPIADVVGDGEQVWLSLTVNGAALGGRQALKAAPFTYWTSSGKVSLAQLAARAGNVVTSTHRAVKIAGRAMEVGAADGRDRGTSAQQRVFQQADNDSLAVNPGGDFEGGIRVKTQESIWGADSPLVFGGSLTANSVEVPVLQTTGVTITAADRWTGAASATSPIGSPQFNTSWADCGQRVITSIGLVAPNPSIPNQLVLSVTCR